MNYKLTITRTHPNENFEAEMRAVVEEQRREGFFRTGYTPQTKIPQPEITEKSLEVDLTEAEFAAIKKAVLEIL